VGRLIAGYDDLTNALGGDINSMKDMIWSEKLVGVFSSRSARQMRERRIQGADIDTQLQDLVSQAQSIGNLLAEHAEVLNGEYASVGAMLENSKKSARPKQKLSNLRIVNSMS